MKTSRILKNLILPVAVLAMATTDASAWWNKSWSARTPVTLDTTATGFEIGDNAGDALVLLRLHSGNFDFSLAKEDGTDLRFVSEDDKTVYEHRVEKWDSLMNEAFVWIRIPAVQNKAQAKFWLYSGNAEITAEEAADPKAAYDDTTILAYNFTAPVPADGTKNKNTASSGGTLSEGALIGPGMRLLGNTAIKIPASDTFKTNSGDPLTLSVWLKQTTINPKGVLFDWGTGDQRLALEFEGGAPVIAIGSSKSTPGESLPPNVWKHLAVISDGAATKLFVDGKEYATLSAATPAINAEATLGADSAGKNGLVGEMDEFVISKTARPEAWVRLAHAGQAGNDASAKLLSTQPAEGGGGGGSHGGTLEHIMLFGDIAKNMMFDGWIAVVVCVIMMFAGWTVAFLKFVRLGKMEKGNVTFQKLWHNVAADLTAMDLDNPEAAKNFGGKLSSKTLELLAESPLYHVYHVGSEEIRHRLGFGKNKGQGLSARSIQAIRAALDAAIVHEQHRLNKGIVYLTVSIAGGPYVGLLGTVVGVMITFAIIAKSGEVDVNSIAPGIASALLATTVGLLVAIPALFMYSFLNTRIKGVIGSMQVFIDEFVAKVAEFYPPPAEAGLTVPIRQIRTPEEAARHEETRGSEQAEILGSIANKKA
jgi:biopolymer transport protein ExbB